MQNGDRIYVSSGAIAKRTVSAVADECERRGLRNLELTSSFPYYESIREEVLAANRRGLRLLLHNYFPPPTRGFVINLASADPELRRRSIEHCEAALELSAEIDAAFYSVHAGFAIDPSPAQLGGQFQGKRRSLRDAAAVFYESVATLCDTAQRLDVMLLIENNVLSKRNVTDGRNELLLGVTADDFDELFAHVTSDRLGVLLDVAHLKVSADTLGLDRRSVLDRLQPRVKAVHLSDNDGTVDNNQPFGEDAWFVEHLPRFADAVFVIETAPVDPATLAACVRIVENPL